MSKSTICCLVFALLLASCVSSTPAPTRIPTPRATATSYHPPTAIPVTEIDCLLWSEITPQMEGQRVCVYGTVYDYSQDLENSLSYFYFGRRDQFFLVSVLFWIPSPEGKCITINGKVQLNTYKTPYIKIEDVVMFCNNIIEPPSPIPTRSPKVIIPETTKSSGCPTGCAVPPPGCVIKGNISFDTREKIYHVPGQAYYATTTINPAYGERWFCTEAEAQANGWRKSYQ